MAIRQFLARLISGRQPSAPIQPQESETRSEHGAPPAPLKEVSAAAGPSELSMGATLKINYGFSNAPLIVGAGVLGGVQKTANALPSHQPVRMSPLPQPDRAVAHQVSDLMQQAVQIHQQGQLTQAIQAYEALLKIQPDHVGALNMLGVAWHQAGQPDRAIASIQQALAIQPAYVAGNGNLGKVLCELERFEQALEVYDKALVLKPEAGELHAARADVLKRLNRWDDCLISCEKAIELNSQLPYMHAMRAFALVEIGQLQAAVDAYQLALALDPNFVEAYVNLAAVYKRLSDPQSALDCLDRILAGQPDYVPAMHARCLILIELHQLDAARTSFARALTVAPSHAPLLHGQGVLLSKLKLHEQALAALDQAIALDPGEAEYHCARSAVLQDMMDHEASIASSDHAIAINPCLAQAYLNRGNSLRALNQLDAARANFEQAIHLDPQYADAYNNLGDLLNENGRYGEAIACYDQVLQCNPQYEFLQGIRMHAAMQICDWRDYSSQMDAMLERVRQRQLAILPFPLLGLTSDRQLQQTAAQTWVDRKAPQTQILPPISNYSRKEKIRVGYFSADMHTHATAYLMAELFEKHDRTRFEWIAFSFGPDRRDGMRERLVNAFDHFMDVREQSDLEIAKLARQMEIDLAIDLKGFTALNRVGVFAHRAAPVQVNYLGYPGTMGAPYIDYIVADEILIPEQYRDGYTEKVVCLPDSYQVNDSQRKIADRVFSRNELSLPEEGFVFCCFNNTYKITPEIFDIWMRLLEKIKGSVLWLLGDNERAVQNLRAEAAARGVSPERLIFAERKPLAEHLARHRVADLFVDCSPCNAHTTASDALWAGLPVLTLTGEAFASRVAASLLHAMGLDELIAHTSADYEALAVALASDPDRLAKIKAKLQANRSNSALFDAQRFARHLECAYVEMYQRSQAGLPPDHINIRHTL